MATYLTVALLKNLSTMPDEWIDELETRYPGFVDKQIAYHSRWIDSRLRKRYSVPFKSWNETPVTPITVQGWLARILMLPMMVKRGLDASDSSYETIKDDFDAAKLEVLEAAKTNEEGGAAFFDLASPEDTDSSAITKKATMSYSEASPYVSFDRQRDDGRNEDSNRRGTIR